MEKNDRVRLIREKLEERAKVNNARTKSGKSPVGEEDAAFLIRGALNAVFQGAPIQDAFAILSPAIPQIQLDNLARDCQNLIAAEKNGNTREARQIRERLNPALQRLVNKTRTAENSKKIFKWKTKFPLG